MKAEYFLTILTIITAAFVAFIAFMQYKLAKDKFKFDLFEKRFEIYKRVESFLVDILREANVTVERKNKLYKDTQNAVFLFEDDITNYLELIQKNATKLIKMKHLAKRDSSDSNRQVELLTWFDKQLNAKPSPLIVAFSPYLKFRKWQ